MITFKIPLPKELKKSTNKIYAGEHWAKRKEFKDLVHSYAAVFCKSFEGVTSFPVQIEYSYFFKSRPLDSLNTAYISKCFEDAFRSLEIIPDDDIRYVRKSSLEVSKLSGKIDPCSPEEIAKGFKEGEDYIEITIKPYENNNVKK